MDNLTHSLTGLMLSRAGLDRLTPRASWLMLLAANAPDCDVLSAFGGATVYFQYHRWITHAIIAAPVIAALPVLVIAAVFRKKLPWFRAWAASLIGVASHLLLDFTNAYGIRLLLPFSDEWLGLNQTHVIDVWIWAILLLGVAAPAVSRLVSSEIGASRTSGQGWAIFALVFIVAYNGARYFLHDRSIIVQEARLYQGSPPRRVEVFPTPVNPLSWQGFTETETFWSIHDVNLKGEFDPSAGRTLYKIASTPAIKAAQEHPLFQAFLKFAKTPYWSITSAPDRENYVKVDLQDLRFGFTVTGYAAPDGTIRDATFKF